MVSRNTLLGDPSTHLAESQEPEKLHMHVYTPIHKHVHLTS